MSWKMIFSQAEMPLSFLKTLVVIEHMNTIPFYWHKQTICDKDHANDGGHWRGAGSFIENSAYSSSVTFKKSCAQTEAAWGFNCHIYF